MLTCLFEDGGKGNLRHVVVHAIVENQGKFLLVKRAGKILETGKWSLPSGFLDRNETAKQCALRELKEETGWEGEILELFRINTNPNRPKEDRQNVVIEFIIKPIKQIGQPDKESSQVKWFSAEQLPPLQDLAFDHGESIGLYLKYRKKNFLLPLLN